MVLFIGLYYRYNTAILSERVMAMYSVRYMFGHIQVYDGNGNFLFSADNEREVREELAAYEESAA